MPQRHGENYGSIECSRIATQPHIEMVSDVETINGHSAAFGRNPILNFKHEILNKSEKLKYSMQKNW